jgi:Endonuclease/Exonuclease/phosphatase family
MATFLFWNVNKQSRGVLIARLAAEYDVDVIVLAETADTPDNFLSFLNHTVVAYSYAPGIGNTKIKLFVRFSEDLAAPVFETDRLTVRRINLPGAQDILLAAVHFPSKHDWSEDSQAAECYNLASEIRGTEEKVGHQRTILVGDLNMNPFENGLVSAVGLHAVSSRSIAKRGNRKVQAREYPFFYNPMWGLFGDATPGPPGTFYYARAEQRVYFWNIFDQILIRPALLDRFESKDLMIVSQIGDVSLLGLSGFPDARVSSDHLPILFRLSL